MTPRSTDYQARKDRVLTVVVGQYINNVTPISSQLLVKKYFSELSSATLRNILAELEDDGLLMHPHTSAGRVPTQHGYRYYVDNLMNEILLLEVEKARIQSEYHKDIHKLETLLENTSQAISDVTHYTSIVSIDGIDDKIFCRGVSFVAGYPEFHDFSRIRKLLDMLEEKEELLELINRQLEHKVDVFIGHELECDCMDNCALVISKYKKKNGPSGRIAILGPTRMHYEKVVSALDYASDLISTIL